NAKPSNSAACFIEMQQPNEKPDGPEPPLAHAACCPKNPDDGHETTCTVFEAAASGDRETWSRAPLKPQFEPVPMRQTTGRPGTRKPAPALRLRRVAKT